MSSDSDPIERLVRLMHERWGGDDLSDDEYRLAAEEWAAAGLLAVPQDATAPAAPQAAKAEGCWCQPPYPPWPQQGDDCPHCPDGHQDPRRVPWNVTVSPQRDSDGQPQQLVACRTQGSHVAQSDAEWLWALIRHHGGSTTAPVDAIVEADENQRCDVYVHWSDGGAEVAMTREPWEGVNVDLDAAGLIVGFEFLDARSVQINGRSAVVSTPAPAGDEAAQVERMAYAMYLDEWQQSMPQFGRPWFEEEWAATEHPALVIEREKWERRARAALAALREGQQA